MKKDTIVLKKFTNSFWGRAVVEKNGIKIADINIFYDVTPDWILIYGTEGGSGTGFRKGELTQKIFIGDCEFSTVEITEPAFIS